MATNQTKEVLHAQQILNQAALDNETVRSAQPAHGILSWSNLWNECEMT